jgi:hypothetical protein
MVARTTFVGGEGAVSDHHVRQIRNAIERDFLRLIDMSDAEKTRADERDNVLLSRALVAFAVSHEAEITPDLAAAHVTDGFHDQGIDAFYYDAADHHVVLAQGKWIHSGTGSLKTKDVRTFTEGVRLLLGADLTPFNARFRLLEPEINAALSDPDVRFTLVLAYPGLDGLSPETDKHLARFLAEYNRPKESFSVAVYSQARLHDCAGKRAEGEPVVLADVVLHDWSCIQHPYVAYQGQVASCEIAGWHEQYESKLFRKNLRQIIPKSDVHAAMGATLKTEPHHFWYFNNGITVICESIKPRPKGGASRSPKSVACIGVSVVNGAQTVGAIAAAHAADPSSIEEAWVSVRLISLEGCPPKFAEAITRATNTQASIVNRDFAALDEHQRRLRRELLLDGKEYAFRTGEVETPPPADRGCTIDEATVALACEPSDVTLSVIAKSAIGRIWEDTTRHPYTTLFHAKLTGAHLWRAVEVHRLVDTALLAEQDSRAGREKQASIHGNRFVEHHVFQRLRSRHGAVDAIPAAELTRQVPIIVKESLDSTVRGLDARFPGAYLQMLFKAPENCRQLDDFVRAESDDPTPPVGVTLPLFGRR